MAGFRQSNFQILHGCAGRVAVAGGKPSIVSGNHRLANTRGKMAAIKATAARTIAGVIGGNHRAGVGVFAFRRVHGYGVIGARVKA